MPDDPDDGVSADPGGGSGHSGGPGGPGGPGGTDERDGPGPATPYPVAEIAAAWQRESPGTPTESIEIVTPIFRLAKLFTDDRARALHAAGIDAATLDLLSVIRRSGPPYALTTREIGRRTLVTAGAVSQRVARAERDGLVTRAAAPTGRRAVLVSLTPAGHALIERSVDGVLSREAALVTSLTEDERHTLIALLGKLSADVTRRVTPDGPQP
ncbi:MarR family winged helix-turn-helix transcriptional regulator [Streptomyces sp. CA-111067]|uniref:MarR family winged helix-turn-helix transcriptional regulator n=1 Tax=Streptomyces sp. CA-111067 TaxID=3240046 RepID=UPI003D961FFE